MDDLDDLRELIREWRKRHPKDPLLYSWYKKLGNRPNPDRLASLDAKPKMTKGDSHRQRFRKSHPARVNMVEVYGLKYGRIKGKKANE